MKYRNGVNNSIFMHNTYAYDMYKYDIKYNV